MHVWLHTRACGFYMIVEDAFMFSSSRHAQQAGLRCRRVTDNEETLQRRHAVTHHNLHLHKPPHWKRRRQVNGVSVSQNWPEFIFKMSQEKRTNNKMKVWNCFQVCGVCCTLNTFAKILYLR